MRDEAQVEAKTTQVEKEMKSLNIFVDKLETNVNKLEGALGSVLLGEPSGEDSSKDEQELVPLAGGIRSSRRTIARIADQVCNILDRLEL